MYDFATDGFTNYKNVDILYSLYRKGLLRKHNHFLIIVSDSFRNYLITKTGTTEIAQLQQEVNAGGKWGSLRTIFLVVILLVIVFLFIVQEDISKRIFAIVTSLAAVIPLMLKLFDSNSASAGGGDKK